MCEKHDLHHILGIKHGNSQMLCMLASISAVCGMFDLDNKYCKAQVWATTDCSIKRTLRQLLTRASRNEVGIQNFTQPSFVWMHMISPRSNEAIQPHADPYMATLPAGWLRYQKAAINLTQPDEACWNSSSRASIKITAKNMPKSSCNIFSNIERHSSF